MGLRPRLALQNRARDPRLRTPVRVSKEARRHVAAAKDNALSKELAMKSSQSVSFGTKPAINRRGLRPALSALCCAAAIAATAVGMFLSGCNKASGVTADGKKWSDEVKRLAGPVVEAGEKEGGVVPGLVVGMYDAGHTEVFGLGAMSAGDKRVPDGDTVYEIGSVSKVFTSLLLADAVSKGEVTLQDPLSKWLPKKIKAPSRDGKEITLEQLATHSSGLPRTPGNMDASSLKNPYAAYDKDKLFAYLNGRRLERAPGAKFEYSNLGMGVLGQLLADRAGKPYEALLSERITGPLKMSDTGVSLSADQSRRLAPPHRDGLRTDNWEFGSLVGCGGVRSTVNDLLKLVDAHVNTEGSPIADAVKLASAKRRGIEDTKMSIGLGWQYAEDQVTLCHTGQTGGYSAAVFICPSAKKAVVVLANGASTDIDVLCERLIQSMFGMAVQPPDVRKTATLSPAELDRLVGEYPSAVGLTMSITQRDGALFARLTDQQAMRVYPESATMFFYRDVKAELEFTLDAAKRATSVTLHQNGMHILFTRKK